jgi:hypothetical protein
VNQQRRIWRFDRRLLLVVLLPCGLLVHSAGLAASSNGPDISFFTLHDVAAVFQVGYLVDDDERETSGSGTTFQNRSTWEEELIFKTKSSIYHPAFLSIFLDGGPLLVQQDFKTNAGEAKTTETLLSYSLRLKFLDMKPYPFSVYVRKDHPSVSTSLSGRFLTESDSRGFDLKLTKLWQGADANFEFSDNESFGSGLNAIVDESVKTGSFLFRQNYREGDSLRIWHQFSERDSSSGSLGLPIQNSQTEIETTTADATNRFGAERQLLLSQYASRIRNSRDVGGTLSDVVTDNYRGRFTWEGLRRIQPGFGYSASRSRRADLDSSSKGLNAGFGYRVSDNLSSSLAGNWSSSKTTGFDRSSLGARAALNYSLQTRYGNLGASANISRTRSDQESDVSFLEVFDEPLVMTGTSLVALVNEFVEAASIQVSNFAQTQVFVEGLDYRVVEVGSTTSIQRLVGGNIADGQTVLVDYRYQASGTALYASYTRGMFLNYTLPNGVNFFARFSDNKTEVREGQLTTPVNDANTIEFGASIRHTIANGTDMTGEVRRLENNEEISPYVLDSLTVGIVSALRSGLSVRMAGSLVDVEYEDEVEGVDQFSLSFGVSGRLFTRLGVDVTSAYSRDTGGSSDRRQLQHRLALKWSYRAVQASLIANSTSETLGATQRDSFHVSAQLSRWFQ